MQNNKRYIGLGIVVLVLGFAAYIGGRMLNGDVGIAQLGGPNSGQVSISLDDITPAPELPITQPDITGSFVERKDNTIVVQAVTFGMGVGGVSGDAPMNEDSGIRVEIVITGETEIYKEATEFPAPVNGEIHNVQQTVADGSLDDLNSDCFLTVWGRRSGDRIVADVLLYSDPKSLKKPGT